MSPDPGAWCSTVRTARTTGELVDILSETATRFTLIDIQQVLMVLNEEHKDLLPKYRDELVAIMREHFLSAHRYLISLHRTRSSALRDAELDPCFGDYCDMIDGKINAEPDRTRRLYTMMVSMVSAFSIFVLKQPGHPVGTPFPGGARLEEIDHVYYCPVKRANRMERHSLCRFCCAVYLPQPVMQGYAAA